MNTIPPKQTGLRRVVLAGKYSMEGLIDGFKTEAAFRQECLLLLIIIPVLALLPISMWFKITLLSAHLAIMIIELLNSAIESVVDMVSPEYHPLAKRAKDMGSAAVFLGLVLLALLWSYALLFGL